MNTRKKYILIAVIVIAIVAYLSLYTWNTRKGVLDRLVSSTGLEIVGQVLAPGVWLEGKISSFWKNYVYLIDVEKENKLLTQRVAFLEETVAISKEAVEENKRLRVLLDLEMPGFNKIYAKVISVRYGPQAVVDTLFLNKGSSDGVTLYAPVLASGRLVGRVIRLSFNSCIVLPITASASRLAILSQNTRVAGIATGMGAGIDLNVLYVPRSTAMNVGETLITSGLDGIFPKGIPLGEVIKIEEEDLFYNIKVRPYVGVGSLEEVVILEVNKSSKEFLDEKLGLLE